MNKAKPQRSMSLSQQLDQLPGETDVPACDLSNEKLEKTFFFFFFFLNAGKSFTTCRWASNIRLILVEHRVDGTRG